MLSAPVANGVKVSLTRGMLLLLVFGLLDSIRDTFKSLELAPSKVKWPKLEVPHKTSVDEAADEKAKF